MGLGKCTSEGPPGLTAPVLCCVVVSPQAAGVLASTLNVPLMASPGVATSPTSRPLAALFVEFRPGLPFTPPTVFGQRTQVRLQAFLTPPLPSLA